VASLVMVMLTALSICGCKPKPTAKQTTNTAPPIAKAAPGEPLDLAGDSDPDPLVLTPGDVAWRELQRSMRPPATPPEWETNEPSQKAVAEFEKSYAASAGQAADRIRDFYTKFPAHEMAAQAKRQEQQLLNVAAQMGDTNRLRQMQELETARLKDANAPEEERLEIRMQQLQRELLATNNPALTNTSQKLDVLARTLHKEFPKRPEVYGLLLTVAESWLAQNNTEKAAALAKEVAAQSPDEESKAAGQDLLKKLQRLNQPLSIKFKARDGREVDVANMKGKVVLIDWWATWCAPCMMELPKVKTTYEKLHPQGFEIVGISLDDDSAKLQQVIEREKIPWPQYFDDTGKHALATEYGVTSIPAMWLVDKKGVLRNLNARGELAQKVEQLLAEP
jgi:peroxiredoxin